MKSGDIFIANVDGPGGNWRLQAHPYGEWYLRGPYADDERSYQEGVVPSDRAANSREMMTLTKATAKERLLETWASLSDRVAEGVSDDVLPHEVAVERARNASVPVVSAPYIPGPKCEACDGEGYVKVNDWSREEKPCSVCGGLGEKR